MMNDRLYTEKEISAILKRAGQMQAEQEAGQETLGLSLHELQGVAAEVGLDPDLVALAAAELERTASPERGVSWSGLPVRLNEERVIQGSAGPRARAALKTMIDRTLGVTGTMTQSGPLLEWVYSGRTSDLRVTLTPHSGQTKVRLHADYSKLAAVLLWPLFALGLAQGFLFPFGGDLSAVGSAGLGLFLGGLIYVAVLVWLNAYTREKGRAARTLMDQLDGLIGSRNDSDTVPTGSERILGPEIVQDGVGLEEERAAEVESDARVGRRVRG